MYDPDCGCFLTQDRVDGLVLVPPSLNKYLYAYANPVVYFDPDGNSATSRFLVYSGIAIKATAVTLQVVNVAEDVVTAGAGLGDDVVVIPALIGLHRFGEGLVVSGLAIEAKEAVDRMTVVEDATQPGTSGFNEGVTPLPPQPGFEPTPFDNTPLIFPIADRGPTSYVNPIQQPVGPNNTVSDIPDNPLSPVVFSESADDKEVVLSDFLAGDKRKEAREHAERAVSKGCCVTGVVDREGKEARRRQKLKGVETQPGLDRDEFPPAVIKADDPEAFSVELIESSSNRSSGSGLGQEIKDLPDGTRVRIELPKQK